LLAVVVWGPWRLGYDPGVYPWAVLMTAVPLLLQLPGHLLLWVMFGN